jgi:hypothetical protein
MTKNEVAKFRKIGLGSQASRKTISYSTMLTVGQDYSASNLGAVIIFLLTSIRSTSRITGKRYLEFKEPHVARYGCG